MARPLRLEFSGALYHVTSRGDHREDIFLCDDDRNEWLCVLGTVCSRFNWVIHAYCQMTNHYHLLLETVDGNLSRGMRQLNGLYTQRFNRRHGLVGHLYQGRYKAILVQKGNYLLELPAMWCSIRFGLTWFGCLKNGTGAAITSSQIRCHHLPDSIQTGYSASSRRSEAIKAYRQFVMAGKGLPSALLNTRYQLMLGDDAFIERHRQTKETETLREVSKAHRRSLALSLDEYKLQYINKDEAMAKAYLPGAYTMAEIGRFFGVHYIERIWRHDDHGCD